MGESPSHAVESVKEGSVSQWSLCKYQVFGQERNKVVKLTKEKYLP